MTLRWLRFTELQMRFDSGSEQHSTQSVNVGPWGPQAERVQRQLTAADQWLDAANTRTYYPGATVAGFDTAQAAALQAMEARAAAGSPLTAAAQAQQQATIDGAYLHGGNPYDSALAQSLRGSVLPAVDARFGSSGRFGSPAHAGAVATAMTDAMAPYAYRSYETERAAQQAAAQNAPALARADYDDLQQLYVAGSQRQAQAQRELDSDVTRYDWIRDQPLRELQAYRDLIAGNYGQTGTTTTSQKSELTPWSSFLQGTDALRKWFD